MLYYAIFFKKVLALGILKKISKQIQTAELFTIMADETADISNQEQVVICIRWIDDEILMAREEFIAMKPVERCTADMLVQIIKVRLRYITSYWQRSKYLSVRIAGRFLGYFLPWSIELHGILFLFLQLFL